MNKIIDVSRPVKTRSGEPYCEAKIDPRGRLIMESGEAKLSHQIGRDDVPLMEKVMTGKLLVMALDKVDDKLSPEERRKRFMLSCRIEEAMQGDGRFVMSSDDRKRLEAAADLVTNNHFFLYRIHEALETATPEAARVANGEAAHA